MSLIGHAARPTSTSRLGADVETLDGGLHAVCLGFVMQPCTHRRMKSKVSLEPEFTGIWWAVPRVGQGAREAGNTSTWNYGSPPNNICRYDDE